MSGMKSEEDVRKELELLDEQVKISEGTAKRALLQRANGLAWVLGETKVDTLVFDEKALGLFNCLW